MLTLTEITDGFTRSTMSAKPIGLLDLADLVVDLRVRRAGEDIDRAMLRAEAINGDAEAGDDGSHQRELARREQRAARCAGRTEARKDRRDVRSCCKNLQRA